MKTYMILRNGEEVGIYTRSQLKKKILAGGVLPSDKMCQSGSDQWYEAGSVPKLSDTFCEAKLQHKKEGVYSMNPDSVDLLDEEVLSVTDKNYDSLLDQEPEDTDPLLDTDIIAQEIPAKLKKETATATLHSTKSYIRKNIFVHHATIVRKCGYILQAIGLLALTLFAVRIGAVDNSTSSLPLVFFGWALLSTIGLVATFCCSDAGKQMSSSSIIGIRENKTIELIGVSMITAGAAVFVGLLLTSFMTDFYWPAVYGALILLTLVLSSGLALSPSLSRVAFKIVTPKEELLNLFVLFSRVMVLLGPFVFACCSAIGAIKGFMLVYTFWTGSDGAPLTMSSWTEPGAFFLIGSFFPLVAYVLLFSTDMFTRLLRD